MRFEGRVGTAGATERMFGYRFTLEYDGSGYSGWQRQPTRDTVEGRLGSALEAVTGERPRLTAAGRTDAGAHAHGQVVGFSLRREWDPVRLREAINAHLPSDVVVVGVELASTGFHARFDALSRTYRYLVVSRSQRMPLSRRYAWYVAESLDLASMRAAADALEGSHDFASFGRSPRPAGSTIRTIHSIRIRRAEMCADVAAAVPVIVIEVTANAFLYGMMRAIAGTLVAVGRGRIPVHEVTATIAQPRGLPARVTVAPAHGLHQWMVTYPADLASTYQDPSRQSLPGQDRPGQHVPRRGTSV